MKNKNAVALLYGGGIFLCAFKKKFFRKNTVKFQVKTAVRVSLRSLIKPIRRSLKC